MLQLRTLGSPSIESDGGPLGPAASQRKALALLGLLAPASDRGLSRDKILAYLWPETPADRGGHRLTQLLYSLRRDLGADDLFLGSADLRLNPAAVTSDLAEFARALGAGRLEQAAELYRGPFLDGFFLSDAPEFERWVEEQRAELGRRYADVVRALARAAAERGAHAESTHWWRQLAQADPLDAAVAVCYMEALAAAGDRASALRFARTHEARLRDEFDADPDPAVLAAAERLRGSAGETSRLLAAPAASVAVLPFLNLSPERENEYFSDGMTEELTNALGRVPGLQVASRTSCFAFKGTNVDAREIAERLKVRSLVEGSVRKVGNRIRIAVQLVNAADGYHLWSASYDRTLADVFALQEEISQAIVHALPLSASGGARLVRPGTAVLDAYPLYLRGRYFALKRGGEALRAGVEYFEQAVERDPQYALAHAGIGECWALLGFAEFGDVDPREAMPRAAAAIRLALELDPHLAEGHNWRGVIAFLYEFDWTAAEAAFLRAVELKPAYSLAYTWYAVFLNAMGRFDEAIQRASFAAELDPLALSVQAALGHVYTYSGRYTDAIRSLRLTLDLDPASPRTWVWLARAYRGAGRAGDSLAAAEEAIRRSGRQPIALGAAALALADLGRADRAGEILKELETLRERSYVSPGFLGSVHAALGRTDDALRLCELLIEERSGHAAFLAVDPNYVPIRAHPGFQALLRRLALPAGA